MKSALKFHGGKSYLAETIIGQFPPKKFTDGKVTDPAGYVHYVEPFFGGGSVLFANDPLDVSEVVNDKSANLTNFWNMIQGVDTFAVFRRCVEAVPFSAWEFEDAWRILYSEVIPDKAYTKTLGIDDERMAKHVVKAVSFFVVCRQSLAGRMKGFASLSQSRLRRRMNEQASAWLTAIEGLPAVHARLQRVAILNDTAVRVIRQQDSLATLFYLDPPYLPTTRKAQAVYEEEMTEAEHLDLLGVLAGVQGRFALSGYRSDLYDEAARTNGWRRVDVDLPNNAAGGREKRRMTECLWFNY